MAFDSLADRLKAGIRKLLNSTGSEKVEEVLLDIKAALLEGDVDSSVVDKFIQKVREDIKAKKGKGLVTKERVLDVIYNNLVEIVGSEGQKISCMRSQKALISKIGVSYGCRVRRIRMNLR